ncbi:barstar family protein [Saccharothrix sp. 6-C]|uniref:barstar family protein n=1 Tax=Saccharothrix sp. 6-C TaxID=2781735 RepID=UPI0019171D2F|nr:barstar family protein [Saccharothrix sp. 6-C]QQQ78161.1 barstar family protein [Saccharothrix sp. 6-C]
MSGLADLLRAGPPSFHLTGASHAVLGKSAVELTLERRTAAVRRIRGTRCRTATALFDEMAAALQFPAHFGGNWNALRDVLSDLSWVPAEAYLLVVEDADDLLADEADEVLATGLGVLAASAESAAPVPFQFVLQAPPTGRVARTLTANGTTFTTRP